MQVKKREGESEFGYFMRNVAMASFSGCFGEIVTFPIDTAKVRL
jgi:hypothetical protein